MKIAYGTYATPMLSLEESIRMMAEIGYDGVEICISPRHNCMPEMMDSDMRKKIRDLLKEVNFGVPALFMLGQILNEDKEIHKSRLDFTRQVVQLARDLDLGNNPVLSVGIGGRSPMWETHRDLLIQLLKDYGKIASEEGFTLAIEAHANAMVDRTERALWVIKAVDDPRIRLHFDIVHFFLAGDPITDTVKKLVPYTAHTHVTDAKILPDKKFELLLIGQGELDCVEYIKAMKESGWDSFITVEVSTMVWSKPEYNPYEAASFSYKTIDRAFKAVGVLR